MAPYKPGTVTITSHSQEELLLKCCTDHLRHCKSAQSNPKEQGGCHSMDDVCVSAYSIASLFRFVWLEEGRASIVTCWFWAAWAACTAPMGPGGVPSGDSCPANCACGVAASCPAATSAHVTTHCEPQYVGHEDTPGLSMPCDLSLGPCL